MLTTKWPGEQRDFFKWFCRLFVKNLSSVMQPCWCWRQASHTILLHLSLTNGDFCRLKVLLEVLKTSLPCWIMEGMVCQSCNPVDSQRDKALKIEAWHASGWCQLGFNPTSSYCCCNLKNCANALLLEKGRKMKQVQRTELPAHISILPCWNKPGPSD